MEYHESVDYLESLQRRRPKLGTETTAALLAHLDRPHENLDCVQIAGSNGKGSTACMLERILRDAGLDVGLYTSPDLNDLRERIQVNGRKIPKQRVQAFVAEIDDRVERLREADDTPTYFEVLTALALHHFAVEDVDVAVLEVGIGGRYDATSAVDPVASAVTSVSLEHTDILGDTIEEIARDKAQVAPADASLVTGASGAALEAIRSETDVITVGSDDADVVAREHGLASPIESEISIAGPKWSLETKLPLVGPHQATNAGVAATLADQVAGVDPESIARGLRDAHWPGRFEVMSTAPLAILDGAHNPGACGTLASLVDRYSFDDLHLVFGAMREKDHRGMATALPSPDSLYLCEPDVPRAESAATLAAAFDDRAATIDRAGSVLEATERALSAADEDDCVLVTGSLYAVAEARDRWTRLQIPKRTDTAEQARNVLTSAAVDAETAESVADETVHRTIKTYLRGPQAKRVERAFEAIGGTCVRSDAETAGRRVAAVLSGTSSQFRDLLDELADADRGLAHVAAQLRRTLGDDRVDDRADRDRYPWDRTPAVMGILNVTPDSFYDGGEYDRVPDAVRRAREMVAAGANIIDVGGESTRPGAEPVSVAEEIDRVVPVIERISDLDLGVPISVDTRKAAVADAALEAGADIVNDVSGLEDPEMRFVAADHDASLVVMHSLETPVDPDRTATYDDVVEDVLHELSETVLLAERAGLDRDQIVVDPGLGFGKDPAESFELAARTDELRALGCPVMVGHSRKSMFDRVGCEPGKRLPPTLAVTTMAAERGVDVVRVHDVPENVAAVRTVRTADARY
ncbi:dihydropteroate synthase [Haloterrigena sp. SYSU A121-1]|uniref:Probable bifunctional folylpolyglutamate synthase/dihydropteroate synthase n=1 Tax=Haloterrigena gelatinilytica TaxID=2741724 RepID=A0A8J8GU39_9EURY|nr:dihydropteroate synthase [Haloterrigena gelatinilytica]NUB93485.1 dihydropteroate synthase [Haloterrigena gelatinilytica]